MSVKKIFLSYIKKHWLRFLSLFLVILVSTIAALLPAQFLRLLIDKGITNEDKNAIVLYGSIYVASFMLVGLVSFLRDYLLLSSSQRVIFEVRKEMMRFYDKIIYSELTKNDVGHFENFFGQDVDSLNELFTSGVANMATDFLKMIGVMASIFFYSYILGLILLGILPVLIFITLAVRKQMQKALFQKKKLDGNVNESLLEGIHNIEQIKVYRAEEYMTRSYDQTLKSHYKVSQKSYFYDALFSPLMQIIRYIVICLILFLSGYQTNLFGLTIGMMVSAISLITDLFAPIEAVGMEIQTIQKSVTSIERINQYFKLPVMEIKKEDTTNGYLIEINDMSFSYGEKNVFSHFSLEIPLGTRLVLKGASGIGKSTLMKLIMGLLKPTEGTIKIGGIDAYTLSDSYKKKNYSIVYQDAFFSGGTIFEEMTLLDKSYSEEEVYHVLKDVGLDSINDIHQPLNPKEYSTGELALFSIARALLRKPKILFLDEMNAKIDSVTAEEMMKKIDELTKDITVISISHYGKSLNNSKIIEL